MLFTLLLNLAIPYMERLELIFLTITAYYTDGWIYTIVQYCRYFSFAYLFIFILQILFLMDIKRMVH